MLIKTPQIGFLALLAVVGVACSSPTAEELYTQGRQNREADEPVAAMESFIAATRVHSREYTLKARSWSNMATMCRMGERHDLAYALYEQSLEQFVLAKDTLAQAYALNNMAWEQAVQGNKPEALSLIHAALNLCADTAVQHKVLESRAAACLYAAEYDSVLIYTNATSSPSTYFDMLQAQAYTFLGNNDSALHYAKRVVTQTDNPRYLDNVYYILTYCDSTAQADEVRALAATRTDILMDLERTRADWIEAMRLAENALTTPDKPLPWWYWLAWIAIVILIVDAVSYCIPRRKQANSLEQQCRVLRKSTNLREELQWNNYPQFRAVCDERLSSIVTKLEQRGLSEREIRICVLVLIGLSYAQMAEVLYRAESGIGKDKYMIAKRLGVSVKDLQPTLINIANETHA